jgi:peptidyl-tRNA hydrolase, PTH2 family
MEDQLKVHVVIRGDLEMTRGKICVQASHATIGLHVELIEKDPMGFALWSSLEYPMETYEGKDQASLFRVQMLAKQAGMLAYVVHDAGRTQVAPHTPTVCAFGPCTEMEAKSILEGVGIKDKML